MTETDWDFILSKARECRTKAAWEKFFSQFQNDISLTLNSKIILDIFKLLQSDGNSHQYSPQFFGCLIQGCLASWDLKLGHVIFDSYQNFTAPEFAIPAARLHLESGHPQKTRSILQKTIKLKNISEHHKVQLDMLLISAFAEEGKSKKALSLLHDLQINLKSVNLDSQTDTELKNQIARVYFFLGSYLNASQFFIESSEKYEIANDWEALAKACFNAACCFHNCGTKYRDIGFQYLEKSKRLSQQYNFRGNLAHIESFYGLDSYHHGHFEQASFHLKLANKLIPDTDLSYRKLHILSMLTLTYLANGQKKLANKYGQETLALAELDESNRHKTRYTSIKAELLWENGQIEESISLLEETITIFKNNGIHTLEELATYTRYLFQTYYTDNNIEKVLLNIKIDEILKENSYNWLDFLVTKSRHLFKLKYSQESHDLAKKILIKATEDENIYHQAHAILILIEHKLASKQMDLELDLLHTQFQEILSKLGDTPLLIKDKFIYAAKNYHKGDFTTCVKILKNAQKENIGNFVDQFVLACWISTIEGKSSKITQNWQYNIISNLTKLYFSPSIEKKENGNYIISGIYPIDLDKLPLLNSIFSTILAEPKKNFTSSELQKKVWNQSLNSQGWQQKIRNSIMRLRYLLPYTMAPLILQKQNVIFLFNDAVEVIEKTSKLEVNRETQIKELLKHKALSSSEISTQMNLSPSTTKRIIKSLVNSNEVIPTKLGREILYSNHGKN